MRVIFLGMALLATFATRGLAAPSSDLAEVKNATDIWERYSHPCSKVLPYTLTYLKGTVLAEARERLVLGNSTV